MYCQRCGKEIPDNSRFCTGCGTPVAPSQILESAYQSSLAPENEYTRNVYKVGNQPAGGLKPVTRRWPASCGVMGVLYLLFFLAATVMLVLYYNNVSIPMAAWLSGRIIPFVLALAVPVLFFTPTKKLAFLTAIPMVLNLVYVGISTFSMIRRLRTEEMIVSLVEFGFLLILAVFYVIQMTVRPRSAALPVLYLIFSILYLLAYAVMTLSVMRITYRSPFTALYEICTFVSMIFLAVGYIVAMFSSRKR